MTVPSVAHAILEECTAEGFLDYEHAAQIGLDLCTSWVNTWEDPDEVAVEYRFRDSSRLYMRPPDVAVAKLPTSDEPHQLSREDFENDLQWEREEDE